MHCRRGYDCAIAGRSNAQCQSADWNTRPSRLRKLPKKNLCHPFSRVLPVTAQVVCDATFLKEVALRARIYACPRGHAGRFTNRQSTSRSATTETLTPPPSINCWKPAKSASRGRLVTYRCLAPKLPMIFHWASLCASVPAVRKPTVQLPATSRSELSLRGP